MVEVRAAVCRAFGAPLSIERVHLRAPGPREVEVTLAACAICHSDISYADGIWGGTLPAVYGHEATGHISALGDEGGGLTVGMPVIATLIRACGECPSCATGRPTACIAPRPEQSPLTDEVGAPLATPLQIGAFAERVIVDRSQVAPIPEGMPAAPASTLACGVVTGVGAATNAAKVRVGEDVVVIGAGGVGLNAIQGARIAGARRIVAIDLSDDKLAAAREFGATDTVLATEEAPWWTAHRILGRGADVVIVTVGSAALCTAAPKYIGPAGRVILVGLPASGAVSEYEPANIASAGQSIVGSKMGETVLVRDIPWLVDLYGQGRLKLDELVSRTWSLDEINEAIADTRSGAARRNVIVF